MLLASLAFHVCIFVTCSLATALLPDYGCSDARCMVDSEFGNISDAVVLLQKKVRAISHGSKPLLALSSSTPSTEYAVGPFVIKLENTSKRDFSLVVTHSSDGNRRLFAGTSRGDDARFLSVGHGVFEYKDGNGCFLIDSTTTFATVGQSLDSVVHSMNELALHGGLFDMDGGLVSSYALTFHWSLTLPLLLSVDVKFQNMVRQLDRWILTTEVHEDEKIYGFGEQYTVNDLRGRVLQVTDQEQGVGRGQQPLTDDMDKPGIAAKGWSCTGGSWETTYTDIPYFITSDARGLLVNTTGYSQFDIGASQADLVSGTMLEPGLDSHPLGFHILSGSGSLLGVVEALTSLTGRMSPLPQWISGEGAILGSIGGTDLVNHTWQKVKNAGVPVASLWMQDWSGQFRDSYGLRVAWNWMVDPNLYPQWDTFLAEMAQEGVKATVYLNPFLSTFHPKGMPSMWEEANKLGYLVKAMNGEALTLASGSTTLIFSLIDLTNPAACAWFKRVIRCNALGDQSACPENVKAAAKVYGYMADFGEYLPFSNCKLYSGEDPAVLHGRWPYMWQSLCREAQIEAGRDGEVVFWSRSSSLPLTSRTTAMWMGDQTATWDNHDGMRSALTGMLNGGLSGLGISHSDIGGFYMDGSDHALAWRTPQLLMRWGELSAFSDAIFRTHPGTKYTVLPSVLEVWSTPSLLESFRRSALIHKSLWPYRHEMMLEHNRTGAPVARRMFLHFQDDAECWNTPFQYMLGSEMLVAPALHENVTYTMTYLPAAKTWTHIWTGKVFASGWHNVSTPMGFPAAFVVTPMKPIVQEVVNALKTI